MFAPPSCADGTRAHMRPHASDETHMAEQDDAFQPKLGRIRDRKGRKAPPYIRRILRTAEKATGAPWRSRSFRFTGARIGRGRAHGTISAGRRRQAGQRRAIVPTPVGAVVAVAPRQVTARAVDRNAAEIAGANDGRTAVPSISATIPRRALDLSRPACAGPRPSALAGSTPNG